MRALVLWAQDSSPNLGVRALGEGTAALLRRVWPTAEVDFQNFGRGPSPLPVRTPRSLVRERVTGKAGLLRWLASYDVVVDTRAGDSFADIYGLGRLTTMTLLAEWASQAGTRVVLGPQTIGPFDTRRGTLMGRRSLRRADVVMARDSVSAQHAASLGRPVDVLTTDVVFAMPVPVVERTHDVLLNVSGLLWQPGPHVDHERYRRTVTEVYRRLVADGREVALLAHVLPSSSPDDDVPAVHELAATVAPDAEVLVPGSLTEVREMVAASALVVGSRMHACLNALSVGTPAVPLAYSRKFAPLLGDLGWDHTIDLRTDDDPAASALAVIAGHDLTAQATAVRARAEELLRPAQSALAALL
ncbi:MAG: polysaccharide pyruvyl transferase family protein [Cellulomonadaceae bacterium]|nr:polysaccharide pyruvyl transferase family protein [Cellulomonadaceae bacterium]